MKYSRKKVSICPKCFAPLKFTATFNVPRIHNKRSIEFEAGGTLNYICYSCKRHICSDNSPLDEEYTDVATLLISKFGFSHITSADIIQPKVLKYDRIIDYIEGYRLSTMISFYNPIKNNTFKKPISKETLLKIIKIFKQYNFSKIKINMKDTEPINLDNIDQINRILDSFLIRLVFNDDMIKKVIDESVRSKFNEDHPLKDITREELDEINDTIISMINRYLSDIYSELSNLSCDI